MLCGVFQLKRTCKVAATRRYCPLDLDNIPAWLVLLHIHEHVHIDVVGIHYLSRCSPDRRSSMHDIVCSCCTTSSCFLWKMSQWRDGVHLQIEVLFTHKVDNKLTVRLIATCIASCIMYILLSHALVQPSYQFLLWNSCQHIGDLLNLVSVGCGASHRNRWHKPFSTFGGCSMRPRATLGWVNPPVYALKSLPYQTLQLCRIVLLIKPCNFNYRVNFQLVTQVSEPNIILQN